MVIYLEEVLLVILTLLPPPNQAKLQKILLKNYWKKNTILYVVNKVTAENKHTNGSETPTECPFQLKESSEK